MYCLSRSTKLLLSGVLTIAISACSPLSKNPDEPVTIANNSEEMVNAVAPNNVDESAQPDSAINYDDEQNDDANDNLQTSARAEPFVTANTMPVTQKANISFENSTQDCPEAFYQIKLPNNGKLCQVFAADLPASMIFHVPLPPAQVVEFYKNNDSAFSSSQAVKERFIMHSKNNSATLIISHDGQGTQVDILVKNT